MAEGRPDEHVDEEVASFHVDDFGGQVKHAFVERYFARHNSETHTPLSTHPYTEGALQHGWEALCKADASLQRERTPEVHHALLPVLESQQATWFSRAKQDASDAEGVDQPRALRVEAAHQVLVTRIVERVVATLPYPFTMEVTPEVLNTRPQEWFLVEVEEPLYSMEELQAKSAAELRELCGEHEVGYGNNRRRGTAALLEVLVARKLWITLALFAEDRLSAAMSEFYGKFILCPVFRASLTPTPRHVR